MQLQCRGLLNRLISDKDPVIRAQVLEAICSRLKHQTDMQWVLYCITIAASDVNPAVRGGVFELCMLVMQILSETKFTQSSIPSDNYGLLSEIDAHLVLCRLHPIVNKLTEDEDNSVKCLVASKCDMLCKYMGLRWSTVVLDILLVMLRDPDDLVRATAVSVTPRMILNMVLST